MGTRRFPRRCPLIPDRNPGRHLAVALIPHRSRPNSAITPNPVEIGAWINNASDEQRISARAHRFVARDHCNLNSGLTPKMPCSPLRTAFKTILNRRILPRATAKQQSKVR